MSDLKPTAKFSVGERVLLRSRSTPQVNGAYVVQDRYYRPEAADHEDSGWIYALGVTGQSSFDDWYESALRPIPGHRPADESFRALMARLRARSLPSPADARID